MSMHTAPWSVNAQESREARADEILKQILGPKEPPKGHAHKTAPVFFAPPDSVQVAMTLEALELLDQLHRQRADLAWASLSPADEPLIRELSVLGLVTCDGDNNVALTDWGRSVFGAYQHANGSVLVRVPAGLWNKPNNRRSNNRPNTSPGPSAPPCPPPKPPMPRPKPEKPGQPSKPPKPQPPAPKQPRRLILGQQHTANACHHSEDAPCELDAVTFSVDLGEPIFPVDEGALVISWLDIPPCAPETDEADEADEDDERTNGARCALRDDPMSQSQQGSQGTPTGQDEPESEEEYWARVRLDELRDDERRDEPDSTYY
jgi:hypothetical protein